MFILAMLLHSLVRDSPQELQFFLGSVDELVFDFSDLEYVTSAGLRVLLALQQDMEDHGSMILTHVNKAVMEVFDITGFLEILHILG